MELHKHESKTCPRCRQIFACKSGDIAHCQCKDVQVSDKVYDLIASKYNDCLCAHCLEALAQPMAFTLEQFNHFRER